MLGPENQIMSPSSGKSEVLNRKSGEWIIICVIQIFVIHIKYIYSANALYEVLPKHDPTKQFLKD